jgi:predicted neuraminidase
MQARTGGWPKFVAAGVGAACLLLALVLADSRVDTSSVPLLLRAGENAPQLADPEARRGVVAEFEIGFPHSPTVVEHANGELQAMWFYGRSEAHPDVGLWTSRRKNGVWSEPEMVLDRHDDSRALGYRVHTIGNPVLFRGHGDDTWLAYVNPSIGGWSTSRTALRRSTDNGLSWSEPVQIPTGPFLGMSTLVRNKPWPMAGGLIALPAYHEFLSKYSKLLILDSDGRLVGQRRIGNGIQTELVRNGGGSVAGLLRPMGGTERRIQISRSDDAGLSWGVPLASSLPNPSAPVCSTALANGDTLVAYNDDERHRRRYAFLHIDGTSGEWRRLGFTLDPEAERAQSSYCDMILRVGGKVVMVYSDPPGRSIREFVMTPGWLARQIADAERIDP